MSGSNVNTTSITTGVANGKRPTNSKIYTFKVTLSATAVTEVDLRALQNLKIINEIQGIFIDNSVNENPLTVSISNTGMNLIIPDDGQGMAPIFVNPAVPVLTFSEGNATVTITLTNFPVPLAMWGNNSLYNILASQTLNVSDAALDACVSSQGNGLQNVPWPVGSGDSIFPARIGTKADFASINTAATTVLIAGSPSSFVTGIKCYLSPNATITGGGIVTVTLKYSTTGTILQRSIYVPATASNNSVSIFEEDNIQVQPNSTNDSVELVTSAALTTGQIECNVWGGTTSI